MRYKILEKVRIFSEFFRVDRVDLEHEVHETGEMLKVRRYHLNRPEVIALVLENVERGTLVLVRQFRYSSLKQSMDNGWTLEVVGGLIDPGEEPLACALRETLEETGYKIETAEKLTSFFASVGVSDELIHLYYGSCTDAEKHHDGGGLAHENEDIEVVELPYEEVLERIAQGEITDAKTILAVQWLALKKAKVSRF